MKHFKHHYLRSIFAVSCNPNVVQGLKGQTSGKITNLGYFNWRKCQRLLKMIVMQFSSLNFKHSSSKTNKTQTDARKLWTFVRESLLFIDSYRNIFKVFNIQFCHLWYMNNSSWVCIIHAGKQRELNL